MAKTGASARNKGAGGEREFCKYIAELLDLPDMPKRQLDQTREGGGDVIVPPFLFEVKRQERLTLQNWWKQAVASAGGDLKPVVAYRQNRHAWRFLIPAEEIGVFGGYICLESPIFAAWARPLIQ